MTACIAVKIVLCGGIAPCLADRSWRSYRWYTNVIPIFTWFLLPIKIQCNYTIYGGKINKISITFL